MMGRAHPLAPELATPSDQRPVSVTQAGGLGVYGNFVRAIRVASHTPARVCAKRVVSCCLQTMLLETFRELATKQHATDGQQD